MSHDTRPVDHSGRELTARWLAWWLVSALACAIVVSLVSSPEPSGCAAGAGPALRPQKLADGELFTVADGETFNHYCCDCGLVHNVSVRVAATGKVELRWERDERLTTAWRQRRAAKEEQ